MRISDWSSDRVLFRSAGVDIQPRGNGSHPFQLQARIAGLAALRDLRFRDLDRAVDLAQLEHGGRGAPVLRGRLVLHAGFPWLAAQRPPPLAVAGIGLRSEEHTSALPSLMRISYS